MKNVALALAIVISVLPRFHEMAVADDDPFRLHPREGTKPPLEENDAKATYIPKDLDDCFAELEKTLSRKEIERMKAGPESEMSRYYYGFSDHLIEVTYSLDQWLRTTWRLHADSRLLQWFKDRGLDDADDIAQIIVRCFWRHLNSKPINLDAEIKKCQIYIPRDLDDCFVELTKMLPEGEVEKMKNGPEEAMNRYHHGLGRWMRNKWGLWKGSRLSKWFNDKGIQHPDDMSGIILHSFWRHLNNKPVKLGEQVRYYQDYWKRMREERKAMEGRELQAK
jgi:hypothetical protein